MLLQAGADIQAKDLRGWTAPRGWTALMYACQKGHSNVVEMLLQAGADIRGWTLMLACDNGHSNVDLI
eukprot:gene7503-17100_t